MFRRMKLILLFLITVIAIDRPATATDAAPPPDLDRLAHRIHELVNRERTQQGLAPLAWDAALAGIAREHSADMAAGGYFAHVNPRGEDPTARGIRAGYACGRSRGEWRKEGLAENIFQNHLYRSVRHLRVAGKTTTIPDPKTPEEIAASTVAGWMASEGHRRNILDPWHESAGIGIAVAADGKVYLTQLFC